MKSQNPHFKVLPESSYCEDCIKKDPQVIETRATVDFSEAKEEETECNYCRSSGMIRPAEVLFNGYPSCRECRKRMNVTNYVVKSNETDQKVIITQFTTKKDIINQSKTTRTHNPHMSMALPSNLYGPNPAQTRKKTVLEHSMTLPQGALNNPLLVSTDRAGGFNTEGYSPVHQSHQGGFEASNMGISQMPSRNIGRHDRTKTNPAEFLNMFKSPQASFQKPSTTMSEPKIIALFKKINEQGISSVKSQLLYSSNIDGFSGEKFHQKSDNKSPILVLVTVEQGFKIGGFTYKSMDPKNNEVSDNLSGLICTYDMKKIDFYPVNNNKIRYYPGGIAFGDPVSLDLNINNLDAFQCNLELGYIGPDGKKVLFWNDERKDKDWSKIIKEISVYTFK